MTRSASTLIMLLLLSPVACASSPDTAAGPDPVGCWYFDRDATATGLNLPWGVRLAGADLPGDLPIHQRGDIRSATTLQPDGLADVPFGYWRRYTVDAIEIGNPRGGGLVLELSLGDTELTGQARALGDAASVGAGSPLAHPVRLTRGSCPA